MCHLLQPTTPNVLVVQDEVDKQLWYILIAAHATHMRITI